MTQSTPAGVPAISYDAYVEAFTKPWNDWLIERILTEAKELSRFPQNILDVGTGSARTLIELTKHPEVENVELIGVDFFEDMVEQAKNNVAKHHVSHKIKIIHGDIHALPLPDNHIDLIFGRSVIHHWANPVKAYQEIYRALKPQGVCIIHEPSREPEAAALQKFNDLRQTFGIGPMDQAEKFTAEEVKEQLKQAGLEKVSAVIPGEGIASLGFEVRIEKTN